MPAGKRRPAVLVADGLLFAGCGSSSGAGAVLLGRVLESRIGEKKRNKFNLGFLLGFWFSPLN